MIEKHTNIHVTVENIFPIHIQSHQIKTFHTIRTLEDLKTFDHVVLDTSHAAVANFDLLKILTQLQIHLTHIHLSNNTNKN